MMTNSFAKLSCGDWLFRALGFGTCALVAGACGAESDVAQRDNGVAVQTAALECDAAIPDAGRVPECPETDTEAPVIDSHPIVLWPPNHKMHVISATDCVTAVDACDGPVDAQFTRMWSDEPADARGDGHHAPDMIADSCDSVQLRAERQGPEDGRVYTLEVVARDQAGNTASGTCTVIVPHDGSSDTAVDDGPAVTMDVCPDDLAP
jgi:hypothetical protein